MAICREARWLPSDRPYYYVEIGDTVEDWEEVRARAVAARRIQRIRRAPWTAVYQVRLPDRDTYYLVAEGDDPAMGTSVMEKEITEHHGLPCWTCEQAVRRPEDGGTMATINAAPPERWPLIWLLNEMAPVYAWSERPGVMLCAFHALAQVGWADALRRYWAASPSDA